MLHLDELDDVVSVDDGDAIIAARLLSETLGIGVGISSGANFVGAVMAQNKLGKQSVVTTVFADDNKKYLSTDYAEKQEMKDSYITKDIKLLDVKAYR